MIIEEKISSLYNINSKEKFLAMAGGYIFEIFYKEKWFFCLGKVEGRVKSSLELKLYSCDEELDFYKFLQFEDDKISELDCFKLGNKKLKYAVVEAEEANSKNNERDYLYSDLDSLIFLMEASGYKVQFLLYERE